MKWNYAIIILGHKSKLQLHWQTPEILCLQKVLFFTSFTAWFTQRVIAINVAKKSFYGRWQYLSTYGVIKEDIENSPAKDADVNVKNTEK